ncbi:MAG: livF [Blastococcus sp.]|nr:livF [Blastococcus sp.]
MLEVQDVTAVYGRSTLALQGVSLSVPAGGAVALLGSNGAGKSTLLKAISGILPATGGSLRGGTVRWEGQSLKNRDPAWIVRAGIVQVPEGRRVFARLTIEENLRAGGITCRNRKTTAQARDRVLALFPALEPRLSSPAGLLSGGEQQMLAIGRALMAAPRLLMLDEPSLGLAPLMVRQIAATIREIHGDGTSVLLVEQNAHMALSLVDSACVLEVGRVALEGTARELSQTDEIQRSYLGHGTDRTSA